MRDKMTKNKYEFKGGDNLKGIELDYHNIMMKNELKDGEGAYELSWADTPKSAPSFGGNQMDLAQNANGRKVLLDIVTNAKDDFGKPFLSMGEIQNIEQILKKPELMVGKSSKKVFGHQDEKKIQLALQSKYGKQKIDAAYVEEITSRAKHVEKFIANIRNGPGLEFSDSRVGRCYLFDYDNQYGLSIGGALNKHLNGDVAVLKSGKVIPAFSGDEFTTVHFEDFLKHMKYYEDNSEDVKRRLKNIDIHLSAISADACKSLMAAYELFCSNMGLETGAHCERIMFAIRKEYPKCSMDDIFNQCKTHGCDFTKFMLQPPKPVLDSAEVE